MKQPILLCCFLVLLAQNSQAASVFKESQTIVYQQDRQNLTFSATPQARVKKQKQQKRKSPQTDEEYERLRRQRRMWYALGFVAMGLCLLSLPTAGFGLIATAFGSFFTLSWGLLLLFGLLMLALWIVAFWRGRQLYKKMQEIRKQNNNNGGGNNTNPQPQVAQKQDVIYLKNGSVLKGKLLQIIPNESIKVEIAGGSILVYKMEEVEKITTEE